MKKKYKVLGNSFKQYRQLSANIFELDNKENVITEENIEELINNFNSSKENIYFYRKHKSNKYEERNPIGQIVGIEPCKDEIGLLATIDWNDEASDVLSKEGFYPSVEFIGSKHEEANNKIYWNNLRLRAIVSVEDPASKGVELLCASAEITENTETNTENKHSENKEGGLTMKEKIEELLKAVASGDKEAKRELVELLKKDPSLTEALIDALSTAPATEPAKEGDINNGGGEPTNSNDKTPDSKEGAPSNEGGGDNKETPAKDPENKEGEEKSLSASAWEEATEGYAKKENGIKCSASSINKTLTRAKRLYKAGETIEQCLSACKSELDVLGKSTKKQESVSLSALSEDEKMSEIAKIFEDEE